MRYHCKELQTSYHLIVNRKYINEQNPTETSESKNENESGRWVCECACLRKSAKQQKSIECGTTVLHSGKYN